MSADGYLPDGCTHEDVERASGDDAPEVETAYSLLVERLDARGIYPSDHEIIISTLREAHEDAVELAEVQAARERVAELLRERDGLRQEVRALRRQADATRDSVFAILQAGRDGGAEALVRAVDLVRGIAVTGPSELLRLERACIAAGCAVLPDGAVENRRAEELERQLAEAREQRDGARYFAIILMHAYESDNRPPPSVLDAVKGWP